MRVSSILFLSSAVRRSSSDILDCYFVRIVDNKICELEVLPGSDETLVQTYQEDIPSLSCQINTSHVSLNQGSLLGAQAERTDGLCGENGMIAGLGGNCNFL